MGHRSGRFSEEILAMNQFAMFCAGAFALAALAVMSESSVSAQGGEPKVGDKAPTFEALDDQGNPWKSINFVGRKIVVVYFYPADFTGGCTQQACGFRDNSKALSDKGI